MKAYVCMYFLHLMHTFPPKNHVMVNGPLWRAQQVFAPIPWATCVVLHGCMWWAMNLPAVPVSTSVAKSVANHTNNYPC